MFTIFEYYIWIGSILEDTIVKRNSNKFNIHIFTYIYPRMYAQSHDLI